MDQLAGVFLPPDESVLEPSHAATTFADTVVTEQERAATAHINVQSPSAHESQSHSFAAAKFPTAAGEEQMIGVVFVFMLTTVF